MGTFIEKCFGFYQVREELEARISELETANDQLWQAKENLTKEKADLKTEN